MIHVQCGSGVDKSGNSILSQLFQEACKLPEDGILPYFTIVFSAP